MNRLKLLYIICCKGLSTEEASLINAIQNATGTQKHGCRRILNGEAYAQGYRKEKKPVFRMVENE